MTSSKTYYFYDFDSSMVAHASDEEPQICIATMDTPCKGCLMCEVI